jgi:hypothetical protein
VTPLRVYLVETYTSRSRRDTAAAAAERVSAAAAAAARVTYLRTLFLREDELCLHLFQSDGLGAVSEVVERAGIAPDRIVEAEQL